MLKSIISRCRQHQQIILFKCCTPSLEVVRIASHPSLISTHHANMLALLLITTSIESYGNSLLSDKVSYIQRTFCVNKKCGWRR